MKVLNLKLVLGNPNPSVFWFHALAFSPSFRVFFVICVPQNQKVSKNWTLFIEKCILLRFFCDGACVLRYLCLMNKTKINYDEILDFSPFGRRPKGSFYSG